MSILQTIRSGAWVTSARARGYSAILLGLAAVAILVWVALVLAGMPLNDKPLGTDFSSFYAAGALARDGHAAAAYDMAAHYAREQQLFGTGTPYYAWFYPPLFLLVALPLAFLPYSLALLVWQAGSLLLDLLLIAAILKRGPLPDGVRRNWLLVALAFPAVFINLGHGQNGFLTAALFGGALLMLRTRPVLAGMLFGLLAYKPQFGLIIPFALLAAWQWRAIAGATAAVVVTCAITVAAFGLDIWWGFAAASEASRKLLLEQGEVGFEKLQSTFAVIRMWGGGVTLAYLVQSAVSAAVIVSTAWAWRVARSDDLKAAILLIAALLCSPHVLDYDLTLLGPAIAFLVVLGIKDGFRPYEISLLAWAWMMPLLTRTVAGFTAVPLGWLTLLILYAGVIHRAYVIRQSDFSDR